MLLARGGEGVGIRLGQKNRVVARKISRVCQQRGVRRGTKPTSTSDYLHRSREAELKKRKGVHYWKEPRWGGKDNPHMN